MELVQAGEQPGFWLHPSPVLAQRFEQLRAERRVAIMAFFASANVDNHALAVHVGDLEACQFGTPVPVECGALMRGSVLTDSKALQFLGHKAKTIPSKLSLLTWNLLICWNVRLHRGLVLQVLPTPPSW